MRILALVPFVLAACSSSPDPGADAALVDASVVADAAVCSGALADFCKGPCPTRAEVLSRIQLAPCFSGPSPIPTTIPSAGSCGSLTYIVNADLGVGTYLYYFFDAADKLVSVFYHSDTNQFCGGSAFEILYGAPIPDCTKVGADAGKLPCGEPADGGAHD